MGKMKQAIVALAAVALLSGPAVAQGAGQGGRGQAQAEWDGPGSMARNPVAVLLERREALGLTAEQVTKMEAIQARVERENAPRIEQLRAVMGDRNPRDLTADERLQLRERRQALAPVRDEIRETNRTAMTEVRGMLTAEQQAMMRETMRRRPAGMGQGMQGQGQGMRGRMAPGAGLGVNMVLQRREALGLTAEQVTRLEAIRDGQHASHQEAMDGVREVLTDEQEAKLRELAPRRARGGAGGPVR